jgi:hypothetical protein
MRDIREICMKVIPNSEMRNPKGIGDYFFDESGTLQIRTADLGDARMNLLVLIHEMIEVTQTECDGIKEPDIQAFDLKFEPTRTPGNEDEPGDDHFCPYTFQHSIATGVERIMAAALGVQWSDYENRAKYLCE